MTTFKTASIISNYQMPFSRLFSGTPSRLTVALVLGAGLTTCSRDTTGPAGSARLAVLPYFLSTAAVPGNALAIDQVRVQVTRPASGQVVIDKTYPFATGASLSIDLDIPLQQVPDTVRIQIDYERGTEVLFSGSQTSSVSSGAAGQPITIPVGYTGPGQSATSLTIGPRDTVLTSGDPLQLQLTVKSGALTDSVYVGWSTSDTAQPIDPTGHLVASLSRAVVTVRAVSPTPPGLRDSTTVRIVPKPASLVKVSGDAQSGAAGSPLPLPLVVRVIGADGLGVPGVKVTFAATAGGGSVDSATVVTDTLGLAGTTVVVGPSGGSQSFTATAAGLTVTFGASGGAAPPKTWTGAVSSDWNTAGNWSPSGVPTVTDSVTIPGGTPAAILHTGSYTVAGLAILSGATVTLDTAVLVIEGGFGNAGTLTDPDSSSTVTLTGSGKTFSGSILTGLVVVTGSYALNGPLQTKNFEVLGNLTLNGHTATVTGTFVTSGNGVLTMTQATDTMNVVGTAAFGGGSTSGLLMAGTLIVSGGFSQTSTTSATSFQAGPGHTTILDGTALQIVSFDSAFTTGFGNLVVSNTYAAVIFGRALVNGNLTLPSGGILVASDTTYNGTGLNVAGSVTTAAGSYLQLGLLVVKGAFTCNGVFNTTSIAFDSSNWTIPGGIPYKFLYVGVGAHATFAPGVTIANQLAVQGATLTLSSNFSFPGNTYTEYGGTLDLNGHTLSTGGLFSADNGGFLKMTDPADTLVISQGGYFTGGSEAGLLTAGAIEIGGLFTQSGDPQSFAASGTNAVIFNGAGAQSITFANPGATGSSHFQDVGIANPAGGVSLASDVWALGQGSHVAGVPKILSGSGHVLHVANLIFHGTTFQNVALAYDAALGGSVQISMDSITFSGYNANSATPLITIVNPGNPTGGPFLFTNMTFGTVIGGGTGIYLSATDSNTGDGLPLMIQITSNLTAAEGGAHTVTGGGATVTWQ